VHYNRLDFLARCFTEHFNKEDVFCLKLFEKEQSNPSDITYSVHDECEGALHVSAWVNLIGCDCADLDSGWHIWVYVRTRKGTPTRVGAKERDGEKMQRERWPAGKIMSGHENFQTCPPLPAPPYLQQRPFLCCVCAYWGVAALVGVYWKRHSAQRLHEREIVRWGEKVQMCCPCILSYIWVRKQGEAHQGKKVNTRVQWWLESSD